MDFIVIGPDGAARHDGLPALPAPDAFVWCDCIDEDGDAFVEPFERIVGRAPFDDHVRDALNPAHPSFHDSAAGYELLIFRGLSQSPDAMLAGGSIRLGTRANVFFVSPRLLVTRRAADSRLFESNRQRILEAQAQGRRLPASPEELMLRLLNDMVDRYLALRQPLTDLLERRQRELLDPRKPFRDWVSLLHIRAELRRLESLSEEQLDAIQEWRDERLNRQVPGPGTDAPPLAQAEAELLRIRANDITEHITRVLGHARRLEDSIESAVQLHFAALTHRTSEIMRLLTVITAIFMPLTLITGVFGMNFEFIPGLHSKAGFWGTLGAMALIAIGLLGWFRARRIIEYRVAVEPWRRRAEDRQRDRRSRDRALPSGGGAPQAKAPPDTEARSERRG